jgi:hypothetical protein
MMFVHESQQQIPYVALATRLSAALRFVPGIRPAMPPYNAPAGAILGHGVAIVPHDTTLDVYCYVLVDPRTDASVVTQSMQIKTLVSTLIQGGDPRAVTVFVIVCDVQTQGTHA